jgi:hypothetical protein
VQDGLIVLISRLCPHAVYTLKSKRKRTIAEAYIYSIIPILAPRVHVPKSKHGKI